MSSNGNGGNPWGGDDGSSRRGDKDTRGDRGDKDNRGERYEDDFERALRGLQERLRSILTRGSRGNRGGGNRGGGGSRGGGNRGGGRGGGFGSGWLSGGRRFGSAGFLLVLSGILVIWGLSGFYRVQADEQGVVLRFGKFAKQTSPGLNYHLPWPVESVRTPKVTIINRTDIGMRELRARRGNNARTRDVPEESLMLTGDENIVDVDFSVFWLISSAPDFLFNVQNPQGTVKAVAESTMREVIGQNEIQPILTGQRQRNEESVKQLMQETLDSYKSGISITQVKMQKVDPPAAVIDAFRDVQAARADQERARNEANAYANRVVPEAQGEAVRVVRASEAYRSRVVADAEGEATRFVVIHEEYRQARDITRQRMFLETVERVLRDMPKVIIDKEAAGGVLPYLPLTQLQQQPPAKR